MFFFVERERKDRKYNKSFCTRSKKKTTTNKEKLAGFALQHGGTKSRLSRVPDLFPHSCHK